jgi:hypothetical protein
MIYADINSNPVNPGIKRGASPKTFDRPERVEKCLLGQIFNDIILTHNSEDDVENPPLILYYQQFKGFSVPFLGSTY